MPIAWTSLIAEDPALVFGQGRSPFRLTDLLELARLIDTLGTREQIQSPPGGPVGGAKGGGGDV